MPLPWVLFGLAGALAVVLAWRLLRARARQARLEQTQADTEHSLENMSLMAEWHAAQMQAMLQARLEPFLLVNADRTVAEMNPAARTLFPPPAELGQTLIQVTRSAELDALAEHCLAGGVDLDRQVIVGRVQHPYRARAALASSPGGGDTYRAVVLW